MSRPRAFTEKTAQPPSACVSLQNANLCQKQPRQEALKGMLKKGLCTLLVASALAITACAQDGAPAASELAAAGPTLPSTKSTSCTASGDGASVTGKATATISNGKVTSVSSKVSATSTSFPHGLGRERARSGISGDNKAWLTVEYREYWFGLFIGNRSCTAWIRP